MKNNFKLEIESYLRLTYNTAPEKATAIQLYEAVSKAAVESLFDNWKKEKSGKRACYFSAEFLTGRLVYNNLMNLGLLNECEEFLKEYGIEPSVFEEIEDCALGNGGLGRLAACFLDSAATHNIPLDGYGIRYRYGLFKQSFENGFQKEEPDDWTQYGDPWSVRREDCTEIVHFGDQAVRAVPYDMPVIGYGGKTINTLRLWQSEPFNEIDLDKFNQQDYDSAFRERNRAITISQVLYPNDDTDEGKKLRLKQQYFFASASLQSILRDYRAQHGNDYSHLPEFCAVQLNDTHPVVSIPELLRLIEADGGLSFDDAFKIVCKVFSYTNHTVMAEALETWDVNLFRSVIPEVYPYVVMIENKLMFDLNTFGIPEHKKEDYHIIFGGRIKMANLAVYAGHAVNGVAAIHSEILKNSVLNQWYQIYPDRFQNKTNGITQRRWLALCNPELSSLINENIGDGWITDLSELEKLKPLADNPDFLYKYGKVKREKKEELCKYILEKEGVSLNPDFIFDVQVKRLHEYKRQLLNALSIVDTYFRIKDGSLSDFYPTAYIFGAKSAPGYWRAKGIIKFINEIARVIDNDLQTKDLIKVVFVQNYNVSYAEKIIPAANISEQISTAGTEASGTGNMKFMLNGAVTLGTMDGANIEIVQQAGAENNYIFGADVDEINSMQQSYNPKALYDANTRIHRALDTLVNGTFNDGGTGVFRELYNSILYGASWHRPDNYFLLHDFMSYCDTRDRLNRDYRDTNAFAKKCLLNTASAGKFSSDRTIAEYWNEIWNK